MTAVSSWRLRSCSSVAIRRGILVVLIALLTFAFASTDVLADSPPEAVLKKTYQTTPTKLAVLPSPSVPLSVAWSSDGKTLAALSDYGTNLEIWDTQSGRHKSFPIKSRFTNDALAFVNDEEILSPSTITPTIDGRIWALSVWNPQDGSVVKGVPSQYPDRNDWWYKSFSISPDKSMIVAIAPGASGEQKLGTTEFGKNQIPIYSTTTWQILQLIKVVAPVSMAFSPDSKQVAFGDYKGLVSVYDITTGQLKQKFLPYGSDSASINISALAFSPDGAFVATGIDLFANKHVLPSVRVSRISDGATVASYSEELHPIRKIIWHPDGKHIIFISGGDDTVRIWNSSIPIDPGFVIHLDTDPLCLALSPDGNQLASCEIDGIKVFDLKF